MIEDTQFFNDALLSGFYEWSKKSVEALIDANKNASLLDDSELKQNIKRGLEEAISYTTEIFAYSVGKEWSLQDGTVVYEHGEDGFKKLREKYNLEEKTLSLIEDILKIIEKIKELFKDSDHCYVKTRLSKSLSHI